MKLFKPVSQFRSFPIFLLIIFDQVTKLVFSSRDFFIGFIHVHLVKNYGLGFGLNFGTLANLIVILIALGFFVYYYLAHPNKLVFVLILAGALSNIIDRLYLGYVRDFIDLRLGFTFNLADFMVVLGLMIILFNMPIANRDESL